VGLNIVTQLCLTPYIHFSYTWNYSCYLTEATIHLFRETIGIYCDNNVKHINEEENEELLNFIADGRHNHQYFLNC